MNEQNIWSHLPHFKFEDLNPHQQEIASAHFFNAHDDDGFVYIVDGDGTPFCRNRY